MAVSSRRQFSAEKGICHMRENTITQLPDPSIADRRLRSNLPRGGFSSDRFTDVLRDGARKLIEQAIHAELSVLMNAYSGETLEGGRARLVRHGHLPEREVMTGIGPVPVKVPRVRDRSAGEDKVTFTPSILPRYLRKAKSIEELLPWLYLKGVSTGDFTEALEALLGPNAKGLSAKTVTRLKADWWQDYEAWQKRDLGSRRFRYIWADGVYFKPRMAEEKQCVLVIVGADEYGRKELLAMTDGFRESTQSPLSGFACKPLPVDGTRGAARSQAARTETGSQTCRRRRCPGVLDGAARGLCYDARTKVLGSQDHERAECDAEIRPGQGQRPSARHLAG